METSAVGIPAYPDAHMSFIKALADYINTNERGFELNKMSETEEQTVAEQPAEQKEESQEAPKIEESPEASSEEATPSEEPQEGVAKEEGSSEESEKSVSQEEKLVNLLSKAVEEAIERSTVKRGLVDSKADKAQEAKEALCKMSAGDVAIKSGWFRKF